MRIALYVNPLRDKNYAVRDRLIELLKKQGTEIILDKKEFMRADLIMSLGGDGTFLSLAHIDTARNIPVIGVNLGSVGFLTEIDPNNLEAAVEAIHAREFTIDERLMLKQEIYSEAGELQYVREALNDVVLMRLAEGRIITTDISINGMPVERIPGDGIIVATPTGSTAYSLAAGGPIVHPAMDIMVITPICPHSLHNRSYLAPGSATIELELSDPNSAGMASVDGKQAVEMKCGKVKIYRADRNFKILRLANDRFYQELPKKIQERGIIR